MSLQHVHDAWVHSTAKGAALLVLLVIADCAGENGVTGSIRHAVLAQRARVSLSSVHRVIAELTQAGEVTVTPRQAGNVYTVHVTGQRPAR